MTKQDVIKHLCRQQQDRNSSLGMKANVLQHSKAVMIVMDDSEVGVLFHRLEKEIHEVYDANAYPEIQKVR